MLLQRTPIYMLGVSDDVTASSAPMPSMVASRKYRKCAAECAKLARAAPSLRTRQSFAEAAKSWLMLAALEDNSTLMNDIGFPDELRHHFGEQQRKRKTAAVLGRSKDGA